MSRFGLGDCAFQKLGIKDAYSVGSLMFNCVCEPMSSQSWNRMRICRLSLSVVERKKVFRHPRYMRDSPDFDGTDRTELADAMNPLPQIGLSTCRHIATVPDP